MLKKNKILIKIVLLFTVLGSVFFYNIRYCEAQDDIYIDSDGIVWQSELYMGTTNNRMFSFRQGKGTTFDFDMDLNNKTTYLWYDIANERNSSSTVWLYMSLLKDMDKEEVDLAVVAYVDYQNYRGSMNVDYSNLIENEKYSIRLEVDGINAYYKCIKYRNKIYFSSGHTEKDYEAFNKIYNSKFLKQYDDIVNKYKSNPYFISVTTGIKEATDLITENCKNDEDKCYAIYEWLVKNIIYRPAEYGDPKDVYKKRIGQCEEISKLAQAMFIMEDIPCILVELDNHQMNIVKIDNCWYVIDCTNGVICDNIYSITFNWQYAKIVDDIYRVIQNDSKTRKKIPGVGLISSDGKTLIDTTGMTYHLIEYITYEQLNEYILAVADEKGGGKYIITRKNRQKGKIIGGELNFVAPYNKNCTIISIPSEISICGIKFKVTCIGKNAFKNNKNIKNVIIGSNISSIEKKAFYGCKNLRKVTFKTKILSSIGSKAFKKTYKKIKFICPKKKLKKYKKMIKKAGASKKAVYKKK